MQEEISSKLAQSSLVFQLGANYLKFYINLIGLSRFLEPGEKGFKIIRGIMSIYYL